MKHTITLSMNEIERCKEFSEQSAHSQQPIEYGQNDTAHRSIKEIARDNLIGKLAEVAYKNFLQKNFSVEIELDFDIVPRGEWDNTDAQINEWMIDIKGTRQGSQWFLIEWSKLNWRYSENKLPDVFFVAMVGWNRDKDKPTGIVELQGYYPTIFLFSNKPGVHTLRKGERLPDTKTPTLLQADNFGVKFDKLRTDWEFLIKERMNNSPKPIDDSFFPING